LWNREFIVTEQGIKSGYQGIYQPDQGTLGGGCLGPPLKLRTKVPKAPINTQLDDKLAAASSEPLTFAARRRIQRSIGSGQPRPEDGGFFIAPISLCRFCPADGGSDKTSRVPD
jgi:hypothetical protein